MDLVTEKNSGHDDTMIEDVVPEDQIEGHTSGESEDSNKQTDMKALADDKGETTGEEQPEEETKVDPALIDALTNGFLAKILPDLEASKTMLDELMRNQRILIDTMQQENSKFGECQAFKELGDTMLQSKQYHAKLMNIKKEMNSLHEKSARIKKRAVKLQQQKQKDELHRAHQRDKELEREKMLVAKPAPSRRQQSNQSTQSMDSQQSDTDLPSPSYAQ